MGQGNNINTVSEYGTENREGGTNTELLKSVPAIQHVQTQKVPLSRLEDTPSPPSFQGDL